MNGDTFATWADLLAHLRANGRVRYHAPLDVVPCSVIVTRIYKNGKLRILPLSNQAGPFTADSRHLPRFRRAS